MCCQADNKPRKRRRPGYHARPIHFPRNHRGPMQSTPYPRHSTKIFTIDRPPPVVEEMIALRASCGRVREIKALEEACRDNGQLNIWVIAMRVRKRRLARGQDVVRRSMLRHVALHLRGCVKRAPTFRRCTSRAPARSIAARTKSTRKRGGSSKPTSIGGDPDPVSPGAPHGGAS